MVILMPLVLGFNKVVWWISAALLYCGGKEFMYLMPIRGINRDRVHNLLSYLTCGQLGGFQRRELSWLERKAAAAFLTRPKEFYFLQHFFHKTIWIVMLQCIVWCPMSVHRAEIRTVAMRSVSVCVKRGKALAYQCLLFGLAQAFLRVASYAAFLLVPPPNPLADHSIAHA